MVALTASSSTGTRGQDRLKYAEPAAVAARTKDLKRIVETTALELKAVAYVNTLQGDTGGALDRPRLAAPTVNLKSSKESVEDTFNSLKSSILKNISETLTINSVPKATADGKDTLSKKYQEAVTQLVQATDHAVRCGTVLTEPLHKAQAALESAQKALEDTPAANVGYEAAQVAFKKAQFQLKSAQALRPAAIEAFYAAIGTASAADREAIALAARLEASGGAAMVKSMNVHKDSVWLIILSMTQVMGRVAEQKLTGEHELFKSSRSQLQKFIENEADKYQQQIKKSEAASKTMGCIGNIVGGIILGVSILALPFTGGGSLALAIVGIAVMGGDMVHKAVTGVSLIEKAMSPLMAPLGRLFELIGNGITAVLKDLGVDGDTAKTIGMIFGAIVGAIIAVVVLVVVAAVGKAAAARIAAPMGKMLGKMFSKMLPDLIKQAGSSVSKGVANSLARVSSIVGVNNVHTITNGLGVAAVITETLGEGTKGGFAIKAGVHQRDSAEAKAAIDTGNVLAQALELAMQELVQCYKQMKEEIRRVIKSVIHMKSSSAASQLAITRNI